MSFRVLGLSPSQFRPLFAMHDARLHKLGARRVIADDPHMPCRVSLELAVFGGLLATVSLLEGDAGTSAAQRARPQAASSLIAFIVLAMPSSLITRLRL